MTDALFLRATVSTELHGVNRPSLPGGRKTSASGDPSRRSPSCLPGLPRRRTPRAEPQGILGCSLRPCALPGFLTQPLVRHFPFLFFCSAPRHDFFLFSSFSRWLCFSSFSFSPLFSAFFFFFGLQLSCFLPNLRLLLEIFHPFLLHS